MYIEWKISYFFFISFHRTIFQNILEFRRYICKTTCYSINPTSFICCFGMLHLNIHIFYIYPWCEYSSQLRSLAFIKIFLLADFRRKKNKIRKHPLHFSIYWTLNVKMFIREKKIYNNFRSDHSLERNKTDVFTSELSLWVNFLKENIKINIFIHG